MESHLDETGKALLLGLQRSGKTKTFSQILNEAGVAFEKDGLVDLANLLEGLGLIRAVSYQLPVAIRAELSPYGVLVAKSLQSGLGGFTNTGPQDRNFSPLL